LYATCKKYNIPFRQTGKWIVAQNEHQEEYLQRLHQHSKDIKVETEFLSLERGKQLEPHVRAETAILSSPSTGIIDSHAYMTYLLGDFENSGGTIAYNTSVVGIEPSSKGYTITTKAKDESFQITAKNCCNA
jgi:2-hydroxyglutarate dehydrogenase